MSKKFWSFKKTASPAIKVDKNELKKKLTPIQYRVTQEAATERPFSGEYLKLKENGMYACIVCGEELFSSECKYESGCGWPAFFRPEDDNKLILRPDLSHVGGNILLLALKPDLARTEVTCSQCGSHMGHVFDDGPKPTGKRYCINSAALKFTRKSEGSTPSSNLESKNKLLVTSELPSQQETLVKDSSNSSQTTRNENFEFSCQLQRPSTTSNEDRKDRIEPLCHQHDRQLSVTLRGRRSVTRSPSCDSSSVTLRTSSQDRQSMYPDLRCTRQNNDKEYKEQETRRRRSSSVMTDRIRFLHP